MSRKSDSSVAGGALLIIILVVAIVVSVAAPLALAILLVRLEIEVSRRQPLVGKRPFGLSREEHAELATARTRHESARRIKRRARRRGHDLRVRNDGYFDERNSLSKQLNEDIEDADQDQADAYAKIASLVRLPLERWEAWAKPVRFLWETRLALLFSLPGFGWLCAAWGPSEWLRLELPRNASTFQLLAPSVGAIVGALIGRAIGNSQALTMAACPYWPPPDKVIEIGVEAFPDILADGEVAPPLESPSISGPFASTEIVEEQKIEASEGIGATASVQTMTHAGPDSTKRPRFAIAVLATAAAMIVGALVSYLRPDRRPAAIDLQSLPSLVLSSTPFPLQMRILNKHGEFLSTFEDSIQVTMGPQEVVQPRPGGMLACVTGGDARLTVEIGKLTATAAFRCRPVARLQSPRELVMSLEAMPLRPAIAAVNPSGEEYTDLPLSLHSSNPAILRIQGDRVVPVALGSAELVSSVGGKTSSTVVAVFQDRYLTNLALADDETILFQLATPGSYRIRSDVTGMERLNAGVSMTFTGTVCDDQAERRMHDIECAFLNGATLALASPTLVGRGREASIQVRLSLTRTKRDAY